MARLTPQERIEKALDVAQFGLTDGAHHKQWVIDQMVRALTEDAYPRWVQVLQQGDEGPETYLWDVGTAP